MLCCPRQSSRKHKKRGGLEKPNQWARRPFHSVVHIWAEVRCSSDCHLYWQTRGITTPPNGDVYNKSFAHAHFELKIYIFSTVLRKYCQQPRQFLKYFSKLDTDFWLPSKTKSAFINLQTIEINLPFNWPKVGGMWFKRVRNYMEMLLTRQTHSKSYTIAQIFFTRGSTMTKKLR